MEKVCPLLPCPIMPTSRNSSDQLKNCNCDSTGYGKLLPLLSLGKGRPSLASTFNKCGSKSYLHWFGMLVLLYRPVKMALCIRYWCAVRLAGAPKLWESSGVRPDPCLWALTKTELKEYPRFETVSTLKDWKISVSEFHGLHLLLLQVHFSLILSQLSVLPQVL